MIPEFTTPAQAFEQRLRDRHDVDAVTDLAGRLDEAIAADWIGVFFMHKGRGWRVRGRWLSAKTINFIEHGFDLADAKRFAELRELSELPASAELKLAIRTYLESR